jgi:hypothetical protein
VSLRTSTGEDFTRFREARQSQKSYLLLPHAYFVVVVPVADNFARCGLGVGLVEDDGVGFLRGFARRRVQVKLAVSFALDDSTGDISRPRLDRRPWSLRDGNCYQNEE